MFRHFSSKAATVKPSITELKASLLKIVNDLSVGGGFSRYPDPMRKTYAQTIEACQSVQELRAAQDQNKIPKFAILATPQETKIRETLFNRYSKELLSQDTGGSMVWGPRSIRATIWGCKTKEDVSRAVDNGLLPKPAPELPEDNQAETCKTPKAKM